MGLFSLFYQLLTKEKKGQAAPLLILLIAVILVAMMVVFNTGKVALNRTDTQNAADAGALAAASWLASGQNYIADTSEVMLAASLGFIAMMAALGAGMAFWYAGGVAQIIDLYYAFCAYQIAQMIIAYRGGKQACEQADSQGKAYAFYNAGVDEYRQPEEGEDYAGYRDRDGDFSQWLQSKGYESGVYSWEDTKYRYYDSRSNQWITYKEDQTNQVRVAVDSPSDFTLYPGALPGFSISWQMTWSGPTIFAWVYFLVIPAWIVAMSPSSPKATVTVSRQEPDPDLGLWKLNIPDITSGASAKTTGSSMLGGDYDCKLTGAW